MEDNLDLILAKAISLGYKTPKKVLEIYAETEEENRAAIRELEKQLIQLRSELAAEHAREMGKFWEGDE